MPRKKITPEELADTAENTMPNEELSQSDAPAISDEIIPVSRNDNTGELTEEPPEMPSDSAEEPEQTEATSPAPESEPESEPEEPDVPDIVSVELEPADADMEASYELSPPQAYGEEDAGSDADAPAGEDEEMPDAAPPEEPESVPVPRAADPKPARTPARKKAQTPAKAAASPEEDARRSFFQLDFNELDRDLSPEQRQEWNSIYASFRGRSVMSGTVVGIDRHAISVKDRETGEMERQAMYCAIVIPFRVRVVIPESEMWLKGEERPGFVLRNIVGSKIDFVIINVDREGGFAIGSRRLALRSRRYFFSTRSSLNQPGSRVKCHVLAVGPRRCLVCCHGYDVDLTQRELRYTAIPDLRDEYHPGDELECIVKSYNAERGRLHISVKETNPNPFDGAELRHPEDSRRQGVIAGKYAGGVFCNLPDGVVIMCNYSFQYDDAAFAIGDKVILAVQHYDFEKKQIFGKIVAKW